MNPKHKHHHPRDLFFEPLEDRCVLSGITENWLLTSNVATALPGPSSVSAVVLVSSATSSDRAVLANAAVQVAAPSMSITTASGQTIANGGTFSFGSTIQGQTAPTVVFYVTNNGTATLTLGSLSLPTGFQLVEGLPSSLAPGTRDSFTVAMNTATIGTYSGKMSLTSNDTAVSPYRIGLTGTITANVGAAITIASANGVTLPSGATVDFGSTVQRQTSPQVTFIVRNTGTSVLTLGTLTLPTGFRLMEGLPTSLPAGGIDSFTVALDTSTVGTKSGALKLVSSDTSSSPYVLNLRGSVTLAAAANLSVTNASGLVMSNGGLVDLGTVPLGATGTPVSFVVQNQGTAILTLGSVIVSNGFTVVDPLVSRLLPGQSDTFSVALTATSVGLKSGRLSFTTNDATMNVFQLMLTGQVVSLVPEISVTTVTGVDIPPEGTVSFGSVPKGTIAQQTIIVSNVGTSVLTLSNISLPVGFQLVSSVPASLAPQASTRLVVQLNTATTGSRSGILRIVNNDSNESPYRITLTGQVTAAVPQLVVTNGAEQPLVSGGTVDFGSVYVNQTSPTQTITLTNTGTKTLSIGNLKVPTGYRVASHVSGSLAAGASQSITIELLTSSAGLKSGPFSFTTNDPSNGTFTLALTGQVVANAAQIQVFTSDMNNLTAGSTVDFGTAARGSSGPIQTFLIMNTGTKSLTLGALTLPTGFKLVSSLPRSIAVGSSALFSIQMLTTSVGTKFGTVSLVTNDPLANPFTFLIGGQVT
ncbi:MAG: choice-of-anchor D domain-containing protein [Pirellulales bacterium]